MQEVSCYLHFFTLTFCQSEQEVMNEEKKDMFTKSSPVVSLLKEALGMTDEKYAKTTKSDDDDDDDDDDNNADTTMCLFAVSYFVLCAIGS